MARPLRLEFPGALCHLTARGNARAPIFLDDEDRELFLQLLGREVEQQRWRLCAYCLMDNHYHLLVETSEPSLARGMARLDAVYTAAFNRRHRARRALFPGALQEHPGGSGGLFPGALPPLVLNPVRAKICKNPAGYRWSSYLATLGRCAIAPWLDAQAMLKSFGGDPEAQHAAHRKSVAQGVGPASLWKALRARKSSARWKTVTLMGA